jgi:hypothetical protein
VIEPNAVKTPAEDSLAINVVPYLNTRSVPDCSTVKSVVVTFCAAPAVSDAAVPEQFVKTPEAGVPKAGVTNVGLVANTKEPEPVSSVTTVAKFAEDGVAKNVATPVPKPEIPVATGRPVAFVNVPEAGVPKAGVTNVGLVDRTTLPEPVDVVVPEPPDVTGSAEPRVNVAMWFVAFTTSVPLFTSNIFAPLGTDTPVWPDTLTVTAPLAVLL